MDKDARQDAALRQEIERLKWRISTLETAELECVRAVHALHESEARYRRLLDEAGFPITIHAADDSTILFANPLACDFFGLDAPRPPGRRMAEFFPDPSALSDLVALMGTVGIVRDWEAVVKDGHAQVKVLILTASLIEYEGREAVLATANDITARRHSEALFRSVVEASPDGFGIVGLDRRLTYVSAPGLKFFGHARAEEMLGRDFLDFVAPEEHPRVHERLQAILQGDYSGPSEWTGIRKDGSTFPQEVNGEVLREPDGSPSALFFIVRDLSNRKRVERSMRWAEKLERKWRRTIFRWSRPSGRSWPKWAGGWTARRSWPGRCSSIRAAA
jgi:PAS domain S-box-containing protein